MFKCIRNKNLLLQFLFTYLKSILNFEHFFQKMILIVDVFVKLWSPKNVAI